jgi:pimeloyl-ACP methyl ester carboxylesterase
MLHGQFDSFSPAGLMRDWAADTGSAVTTLVVPGATHNTLGSHPCAIAARDAWIDDPGGGVPDDACADAPPVRWAPPS